jgi:hypothetical protein
MSDPDFIAAVVSVAAPVLIAAGLLLVWRRDLR